ncbi:hypothetical protein ACFXKF_26520 [Streptomyces scopuliridis]
MDERNIDGPVTSAQQLTPRGPFRGHHLHRQTVGIPCEVGLLPTRGLHRHPARPQRSSRRHQTHRQPGRIDISPARTRQPPHNDNNGHTQQQHRDHAEHTRLPPAHPSSSEHQSPTPGIFTDSSARPPSRQHCRGPGWVHVETIVIDGHEYEGKPGVFLSNTRSSRAELTAGKLQRPADHGLEWAA